MVKTVVADETQLKSTEDSLFQSGSAPLSVQVGLVIGKLSGSSDRGQVCALIPTPLTDGGNPACSLRSDGGGGARDEKKKSGSKKPSNEVPQSIEIDGDWVAEHARQNNSLPFNKYAYLTTHNSFAIVGEPSHTGVPRVTFDNQEDSVTQQLKNGVRALMLDTYDFRGDVWLCHSNGGKCYDTTAFEPLLDTLKEIEAFLSGNPTEIVTIILEDYVKAPNGLTKVFNKSGLMNYWFPVSKMPQNGKDWPRVSEMVAQNHRLLVFTSMKSKEQSEGIAYQWKYMVENQYGDGGMDKGKCFNRDESPPLNDPTKSLVLVNYFPTVPVKLTSCLQNSRGLNDMLNTCYDAAGHRWANFLAVNYYKRSDGQGVFGSTDLLNGRLLCGCDDVLSCSPQSSSRSCSK